ncbi:MAG: translation initiation factor IF-2 [Acidobacteria bacterium]|nr:translation initiation factor IF-2 [Acidobacteriota bacterium]
MPVAPGDARGEVILTEGVTVKELAEKTGRGSRDLIRILLGKGLLAAINQTLDRDLAVKICEELGFRARVITFEEEAIRLAERPDEAGRLVPRDPVVTVMGHVDHGKTSLLDAIRNTNVVAREHGGITQHIGAYHVTRKGRGITFLDTPGHEAFTRMRARGAQVTDIVVLVVAADDGVMPHTLEAIDLARAAGVPVVTALNKMDKPEANPDKVKKALADAGVLIEEYGGESVLVPVSAKQGRGIEEILEMILLVADMRELRANPDRAGSGTVIEAKLDRTRGAAATVLVQNGTVRVGDAFIAGAVHGKVRAMFDENRDSLRSVGPSRPVEILGLQGVPQAGDIFQVLEDEARARQIGALRQLRQREEGLRRGTRLTLESLHDRIREGEVKELPLILKGDVQGSVEALSGRLAELSDDRVQVKVLHAATGPINESDVLLASASNAIVIGFNVRTEPTAEPIAAAESVDIRLHNVIYEVEDQIRNAMAGLLEPEQQEVYQGRAEVREVFRIRRVGTVAGCYVQDGLVRRNSEVRVLRGEQVLFQGKAQSLRRFKEDVAEVKAGFECGISIGNFDGFQVGDRIEAFRTEISAPAPAARPTA